MSLLTCLLLFSPDARALDWDHEDVTYGTEDPDRQWLNIFLADSVEPTPVLLWAHSNGSNAFQFGDESAALVTGAGYSIVSWESLESLATPDDVQVAHADMAVVFDWVIDNAGTYNFDPDRIVVAGRSRGSVASWQTGHSGHPSILGNYFYNALPDRVWAYKSSWNPIDDLSADSPPMYLAYGPIANDGDSHNPANLYPVVDEYEALGLSEQITLTEGMTAAGLDPLHFFPEFATYVAGGTAPVAPELEEEGGRGRFGCSVTSLPAGVWWAPLLGVGLLAARRRRAHVR